MAEPDIPEGLSEEQTVREILRKIRRIELKTRKLVRDRFGGEYHSRFKGQGIDFDDFREYQHGDEVRDIDWNVTARFGAPYIKKFMEERELTVFLTVDISDSGRLGSKRWSKRELAAEVAALLAFSALRNGDKVGLILFADDVELFLPPKKGSQHVLRLIREILFRRPQTKGTRPGKALDLLTKNPRTHRSLVFLISDFLCEDFTKELQVSAMKHDLVAVQISDPVERQFPNIGKVRLLDAETGECVVVNTSNLGVRRAYTQLRQTWQYSLDESLKRLAVDKVDLRTDQDYLPALHALFQRRSRGGARSV